jgi:hypothetical protein
VCPKSAPDIPTSWEVIVRFVDIYGSKNNMHVVSMSEYVFLKEY